MAALRRARCFRDERGAELVEFALVLPLLLLVTLGIIDFGLLFQRYQVVTNAAREGARVAVLPGYAEADAHARVVQFLQASNLNDEPLLPPLVVLSEPVGGGRCIWVTEVVVSYPHDYLFLGGIMGYFGGALGSDALTATVRMRSEGPSLPCP